MNGRRLAPALGLLVAILAVVWMAPPQAITADAAVPKTLTWEDLVPSSVDALVDPFEHLTDDQFFDLQTLVRLRAMGFVVGREVRTPEGVEIVKRMRAAELEPFALLERFTAFVAEIKEVNAETVGALDGQLVRLPGFVLPLSENGGAGAEFLLVPYVGACIHVPAPPPNQMVLVAPAGSYQASDLFEPVWVTGRLSATASRRDLFLVDGSRTLDIGYHLAAGAITAYDP